MPDDPKTPVQEPPKPEPTIIAGDPPAGDPPAPAAEKPAVPDKYELKFADGTPLDPTGDLEKITIYAKSNGLSNEQAQKHLEHVNEIASGIVQRQQQEFTNIVKQWETETWADKALGGANKLQTEANVKRAIDKYGTPEFLKFVNEYGFGNKREFVAVFNAIGKAMAEDKPANGSPAAPKDTRTPEQKMYPTMHKTS